MTIGDYAFIGIIVAIAYSVYGMTGFGAAMVGVPILVQSVPLQFAVPMMVLLDLICTSLVGGRNWRRVARDETLRLLPAMLIGVAIGTNSLAGVGPKWPLIALGTFVLAVAVGSAWPGRVEARTVGIWWSVPAGVVGGILSALFGTGGPVYTIYLARRVFEPERFRATISVVILASGITRALAFGTAGLYGQHGIFVASGFALPCSLLGVFFGSRLRHSMSSEAKRRVVLSMLAFGGCSALYRGLSF